MTPNGRNNAKRAARQLDALAGRSSVQLFSHSPNDVLVQIALPLILILAITTRLTMLAYTMVTQQDNGPAVMELWQQQLIMRIDQALDTWAADAQLPALAKIQPNDWTDAWPTDPTFQVLCAKSQALNTPSDLRNDILAQALAQQDAATSTAVNELLPPNAAALDSDEAAYAATYIDQRLASWANQVEALQWSAIATIAGRLPLGDQAGADDAAAQLRRIATELASRGFPLLNAVQHEYQNEATPHE